MKLDSEKIKLWCLAICVLLVANFLAWRELHLMGDDTLHVHFLDVDQGDATLLITPSGKQVLIDGGPNLETLEHLGTYMPFFDRTIEVLVLTHPDTDHLTALPDVLRRYTVASIVLAGTEKSTAKYLDLLHEVETQHIPVIWSNPLNDIVFDDGVTLEMIWPDANEVTQIEDANDASVTLRVVYEDYRILLPGDIETLAEQKILESGRDVSADILKMPHHGSRTSSSTGFLLAVHPSLAIASTGQNNQFGHPHPEIVDRYEKLNISVRNTAEEGTISLEFK